MNDENISDTPQKKYKLLGADGKFYFSDTPPAFDGWTKGKIYGRLDCPKTKSELARGNLKETRVFFKDEETAIAAGYRPCYFCLREKYFEWQRKQDVKKYKLLGADGKFYFSEEKGTLGGNGKHKIYGRLDCPAALSSIKRWGEAYTKHRVFFKDEETAIAAGFRPCGTCMREKYLEWKKQTAENKRSELNGDSCRKN